MRPRREQGRQPKGFGHQWKPVRVWIFSRCSASEGDALAGNFCVKFSDRRGALVDDRLVDESPDGFGWLQLWTEGRQINEADVIGDL